MRFYTVFKHHLRGRRTAIIAWGATLFLLAAYLLSLYDAFASQQQQYMDFISVYPPELMAAFGGMSDMFSPAGFLNFTLFSYITVLLGFLAISLGSGMLAADEERAGWSWWLPTRSTGWASSLPGRWRCCLAWR